MRDNAPETTDGPPVVILRWTWAAGAAEKGERWVRQQLGDLAGAADLLGVDLSHDEPDEVRLTAKFSTARARDDWAEKLSATFAGQQAALILELPRVTRTTEDLNSRNSEVILAQVPAGREQDYLAARKSLGPTLAGFPGFTGMENYPPGAGEQAWSSVITFDTQADLDRWLSSPERADYTTRMADIAPNIAQSVPSGYGSWFSSDPETRSGPVWKQAMVVIATIYATVSLLNMTLGNLVGQGISVDDSPVLPGLGLPFPVVVFIGNVAGTILMTWVLMPIVTRAMNWWLRPDATAKQTGWGIVVLLVVYAAEMALFTAIFDTWQI